MTDYSSTHHGSPLMLTIQLLTHSRLLSFTRETKGKKIEKERMYSILRSK